MFINICYYQCQTSLNVQCILTFQYFLNLEIYNLCHFCISKEIGLGCFVLHKPGVDLLACVVVKLNGSLSSCS